MSSEYCVHSIDGPVEVRTRRIAATDDPITGPAFYVLEISGEVKQPDARDSHRFTVKMFGGAEPPVLEFDDATLAQLRHEGLLVSEPVAQGAGEVG